MNKRRLLPTASIAALALTATTFLTSCTASSTEPISAAPSASSTSRSAAIDTIYQELCIENQSGSPISFRYSGEKIISGDLSGEIPKKGTTCATGWLEAEIKLPELENYAKMRMQFMPGYGWTLFLNSKYSGGLWDMFESAYVEDAGYRMDVTYFQHKISYNKDDSDYIDYQVDSYKVVVY